MIQHLSIPQYLLESSFCLLVFYLFYRWFLKNETYFQFNRFYLIGTALLSLFIPILNIDFQSASQVSGAEQIYPLLRKVNDLQIGIQQTIDQESNILHISVADVINWIYMAGLFVMSLKLLHGLFRLFGIINRAPRLRDRDHTLLISEDVPASSFFSYIFWRGIHDKSDPIQKTIMDHELVHVRQWHSLDVVAMELMVIIKWFNPLIYLFRNSLKNTHEFIADRYVTRQMGDKMQYANILLKSSVNQQNTPLANHFYGNIKERIKMLGVRQSSRIQQLKYFAIMPLTLALFSLFSFDLSERLPQPLMNSFQVVENSMLAAAEKNVISLNVDEEKEKSIFHLNWSDLMKIKLEQTNEIQEFLFYYYKEDLNTLLSGDLDISQNGKKLAIYIDSLELVTSTGKKGISLTSLKDKDFRKYLIDSLQKHDQILLGLKTYSDTDSLFIKLHLGIHSTASSNARTPQNAILAWGDRLIHLDDPKSIKSFRHGYEETITESELNDLLGAKIKVKENAKNFKPISEQAKISFSVFKGENSRLENVDSKWVQNSNTQKEFHQSIVAVGTDYYSKNGKYTIIEESKSISLESFYLEYRSFQEWMSQFQNEDVIQVNIMDGTHEEIEYQFNLRIKDEYAAITPPFPIETTSAANQSAKFQIVLNDSGKSFLRIDTKDPGNQVIINSYLKSESYEIVHVDNFTTKNRVVKSNLPKGVLEVEQMIDPKVGDIDILKIQDYYTEKDAVVRMHWGKMVSMPAIGNFSLKEFKRSARAGLQLYVGTEKIDIARYDLLIIPENGKIKRIRTDHLNSLSIRKTLNEVRENTSIYVDNIVVEADNTLKYYPQNFVFTVE